MRDNKENMAHSKPPAPHIDCILIGVNCSSTIGSCIESVRCSDYPQENIHIIYVDGGSSDNSIEIARRHQEVSVIELHPEHPTPGLGRNAGWKKGAAPFIQFLDSDTRVDPQWFSNAVMAMNQEERGAVMGHRKERYPEHSFYNWIGNLEWNGPDGESECFGGDVLIRRKALEATGGYDETLVGGEDPELSRRIIRSGWKIVQLGIAMTSHDLAMTRLSQYLRRAYRSGYGFAAVRSREAAAGSGFWQYEYRKIIIKGGAFSAAYLLSPAMLLLAPGSIAQLAVPLMLALGTTVLLNPRLFKVGQFMQEQQLSRRDAKKYAWHCSVVVLPQLAGLLRFHIGELLDRPLRNRRQALATALSAHDA